MSFSQRNRYEFNDVTVLTSVPDNDIARLMYYFNSVCSAIQYNDNDLNRYRDYENWSSLSYGERRTLLILCLAFSPDEFDDKVFFHSDNLCGNSGNRFYEFSEISNRILAVRSIIIAGQTHRVARIMTYKMSWMQNNYYGPMLRLAPRYNINTSLLCVIS